MIQAARDEFLKVAGYADTPRYLIDSLTEDIKNQVQAVRPAIVDAAIAEHREKIAGYKKAQAKIQKAVQNEINRWDPRQLLDHIDLARARIQAVLDAGSDVSLKRSAGDELQALYQEAKNSADPVRLRAAAEVFRSVLFKMPNGDQQARLTANRLQFQAERDLHQLKETDELKAAQEGQEQAWNDLLDIQEELIQASKTIDNEDPYGPFAYNAFTKALRRVRILDGERVIYDPDDPEVTGVDLSHLNLEGEK